MKKLYWVFIVALVAVSCAPKNAGQLTLVNSGIEKLKISVDRSSFTLMPSGHITKDVSAGPHKVSVEGGDSIDVTIQKGLNTLFDSTGLSCYVVVDFAQRQRGGNPQIVETFKERKVFTTAKPMTATLGNILPKSLPENDVLRTHQVNCEIVDDNAAIIKEIANLP